MSGPCSGLGELDGSGAGETCWFSCLPLSPSLLLRGGLGFWAAVEDGVGMGVKECAVTQTCAGCVLRKPRAAEKLQVLTGTGRDWRLPWWAQWLRIHLPRRHGFDPGLKIPHAAQAAKSWGWGCNC